MVNNYCLNGNPCKNKDLLGIALFFVFTFRPGKTRAGLQMDFQALCLLPATKGHGITTTGIRWRRQAYLFPLFPKK